MTTLYAIHQIEQTDPKTRNRVVIPARSVFDSTNKTVGDALIKQGAARAASADEVKIFEAAGPRVASAPVAPVVQHNTNATATTTEKSLDDMTKAELVEHAKRHNIEIDETANKAAIYQAIVDNDELV